jgi:hypothetical protein
MDRWSIRNRKENPIHAPSIHIGALVGASSTSFLLTLCFCPFSTLISVFFLQLYSPPPPSFVFLAFETFSATHLLHTIPLWPTRLYIYKTRLFPIYLLTYKFKMCYSHLHTCTHPPSIYLLTCLSTFLPTNTLSRYLPNPTYMATPTYMVAIPINPQ